MATKKSRRRGGRKRSKLITLISKDTLLGCKSFSFDCDSCGRTTEVRRGSVEAAAFFDVLDWFNKAYIDCVHCSLPHHIRINFEEEQTLGDKVTQDDIDKLEQGEEQPTWLKKHWDLLKKEQRRAEERMMTPS